MLNMDIQMWMQIGKRGDYSFSQVLDHSLHLRSLPDSSGHYYSVLLTTDLLCHL